MELILVFPEFLRHPVDVRGHEMGRDDMLKHLKPEEGYFGQYFALLWDALSTLYVQSDRGKNKSFRLMCRDDKGDAQTFCKMTSYAEMRSLASKRRQSRDDVE